jgi:outer membrane receptor protein involved in Fe transport
MKALILTVGLVALSSQAFAQRSSYYFQAGGSYITNKEVGIPLELEYFLRLGMGWDLSPHWSVGGKYQQVFYRGNSREFDRMWLGGPYVRRYIAPDDRFRLYGEGGVMLGNYCTCGNTNGANYRSPGIWYLSLGGGFEWRVWRGLHLDVGFYVQNLLNRPRPKYSPNVYLLGLLYRFNEGR